MDIETRTLEEALRDLDGGLRDLYGERYRGLVLYGSRARGRPTRAATWTCCCSSRDRSRSAGRYGAPPDWWLPYLLEAGLVLSLVPVSVEDYRAPSDPYLINARREGAIVSSVTG